MEIKGWTEGTEQQRSVAEHVLSTRLTDVINRDNIPV